MLIDAVLLESHGITWNLDAKAAPFISIQSLGAASCATGATAAPALPPAVEPAPALPPAVEPAPAPAAAAAPGLQKPEGGPMGILTRGFRLGCGWMWGIPLHFRTAIPLLDPNFYHHDTITTMS